MLSLQMLASCDPGVYRVVASEETQGKSGLSGSSEKASPWQPFFGWILGKWVGYARFTRLEGGQRLVSRSHVGDANDPFRE